MSKRPFWNPRDVGIMAAALLALGAIPAATRLAPMSWSSVMHAPQWWANLRMLGESTCMTPLYARDATIRQHVFEPSCSYGWGGAGRDDYRITRVRYRFEEAAMLELAAQEEAAFEPEALARFGLPVRPPDRKTFAHASEGAVVRTLRWWDVESEGTRLDLVELRESTRPGSPPEVRLHIHLNRYTYDTAHLRDARDDRELRLALPEGATRAIRDRAHAWLSASEVGVRESDDQTGGIRGWWRATLDDPALDAKLGAHLERRAESQHKDAQLLLYASRGVSASRLRALSARALGVGFKTLSLVALRETVRGRTRQGVGEHEYLSYAQPMLSMNLEPKPGTVRLEVTLEGFTLSRETPDGLARIAPLEGCPAGGVTVCLRPGTVDPGDAFARAARADDEGELSRGREALEAGLARFDYHRLHLLMEELPAGAMRPTDVVALRLGDDVPVALLTRTLTAARIRRGPESPPGSGKAIECMTPPDEATMWGWAPCPYHRDFAVHLGASDGQGL